MASFQDIPDPSFEVIEEDLKWKAELTIFVARKGRMEFKDVRIRGPKRLLRRESQMDGHELKKVCLIAGTNCEAVARKKQTELLRREWSRKELEDFEEVAERLDALLAERKRLQKLARLSEQDTAMYQPIGPNWSMSGPLIPRPDWGGPWMIWQRQDPVTGKFVPHLYFDTSKNEYFFNEDKEYAPAAPPTLPQMVPLSSRSASKVFEKDKDYSLVLPDLHRTGTLAKLPLDFLDGPAIAMALFDNLGTAPDADISFLAKNFHKCLLPKLSARHTEWEDFELRDVLKETLEELDSKWISLAHGYNAGAGAAISLVVGNRLAVASLGGAAVVLVNSSGTPLKVLTQPHTHFQADEAEVERVAKNGGFLDERGVTAALPTLKSPADRINAARNSFEVLDITPDDFYNIVKFYRRLSLVVHPDKSKDEGATRAFSKLEKAKEELLAAYEREPVALEELYEMFHLYHTSAVLDMELSKKLEELARSHAKLLNLMRDDILSAQKILIEVQELMKLGLTGEKRCMSSPYTRALGMRSLKKPYPIISVDADAPMPEELTPGKHGLVLLSSGTNLTPHMLSELAATLRKHTGRPRAAAMALAKACQCSATVSFITVDSLGSDSPPAKKHKSNGTAATPERVFLRQVLVKYMGCRADSYDRNVRPDAPWRERTLSEAENLIVGVMASLDDSVNEFTSQARSVSDCKSAESPMAMCGHIGWVTRGQFGDKFDQVAFDLPLDAISDVVSTDRGLHIIHRMA